MQAILLLGCWGFVALSQSASGDWPQWRGPTHDARAPAADLVESIPADGLPILWFRELGQGYSGFAIVGNRAFTQTQSLYDQSLVCIDAESGATLWAHRYGWPYDGGGLYPGPRSTPAVADGHVFFASPQGWIGCVTLEGKPVWSLNAVEKFAGRGTDFGYSCSPLVIDGLVILPIGGQEASVVALSTKDGSTVWRSGSRPASYSTPVPISWRGEPLVIVLLQNALVCHHRRTGELWWEWPLSQGYYEHAAAPCYQEPDLFISGPFRGGASLLRLEADESTGRCRPTLAWHSAKLSNDVASSVLCNGALYGFDLKDMQASLHRPSRGEFRALDFATGKLLWSSNSPAHAQVIAANDKLILCNDRGEVILASATSEAYRELGRMQVFSGQICWTAPALAQDRLFLRTQTHAACVYLGRQPLPTGRTFLATHELPQSIRFDPTTLLGSEREYPATLPEASEFWRWYLWSLGALTFSTLLVAGFVRVSDISFEYARPIALVLAFGLGIGGSKLAHLIQSQYVFTWPLALWAAFQIAASFSQSAHRERFWSWSRARSYAVGCLFLLICGLYFHLCRWLGLAIEWAFLIGFLGAFPLIPLFDWLPRGKPVEAVAQLCSFSIYYGTSVLFMRWWLQAPV